MTPDKWEFEYAVTKRCAGNAPEGSGVPVGTEYHWYIVAHQTVRKLNANDYTTSMTGYKYKVAHRRAHHDNWSANSNAQRKRLIGILRETLDDINKGAVGNQQASPNSHSNNGRAGLSNGKPKHQVGRGTNADIFARTRANH